MNRGDFILQTLRGYIDNETTFNVTTTFSETAQQNAAKTNVYVYIVKEVLSAQSESKADKTYIVDIGVQLSKNVQKSAGKGSDWRNDAIHKLEQKVNSIVTTSTTDSGITYIYGFGNVVEIGGYKDDMRTNADADAIIRCEIIQKG